MMDFKYEYIDPISKGFKRIKVSRKNHNQVFKYRKRSFLKDLTNTTEYYENSGVILVQNVPSVFGKVLLFVFSPIVIIYHGIGNKEIYTDIKRALFAKRYGAFTSDYISDVGQVSLLKGLSNEDI